MGVKIMRNADDLYRHRHLQHIFADVTNVYSVVNFVEDYGYDTCL